jgi:hypothetical protein
MVRGAHVWPKSEEIKQKRIQSNNGGKEEKSMARKRENTRQKRKQKCKKQSEA